MVRSVCLTFILVLLPHVLLAQDAMEKTLDLLTWTSSIYREQRVCFSCHHQTLPSLALMQAHRYGRTVDLSEVDQQLQFTHAFFEKRKDKVALGKGVPGQSFTAGYALLLLKERDWIADETTSALVKYLAHHQQPEGHWKIRANRPPMEYSDVTATTLAVRGLQLYGTKEHKNRIARARRWLVEHDPQNQEARAFRLLGLVWTQAERAVIEEAIAEILKHQRQEGGWPQEENMSSDAYATGQTVVALIKAGALKTDNACVRKGIDYLKSTRLPDGSWFVKTRSNPIQEYFESGFPHDESQFISTAATAWAAWAILLHESEPE